MARPRARLDTEALARAFAGDGLHGTPIEQVAAAAGIAKPTLYQRFGDKEELFALAVEAEVERLVQRVDDARRAPGDPLSALAHALDEYVAAAPAGARLLLCTARHGRSRVAARVERSLRRIPDALAAPLDSEALAAALLGGAQAALSGGPPVRELARLLAPATPAEAPPADIWTA